MAIEINGIELKFVHRVTTQESGGYVAHHVPGMAGDLSQDVGRSSLSVQIDGIFYGDEISQELSKLRDTHLKREPVEFLAQITGQAYAAKVLIDSLKVMETGELPDQYTYQLVVVEYIEPPAAGGLADAAAVNQLAALEAAQLTDLMEIPDMLSMGSIPELSNPVEPLKGALSPVQEASSAVLEAAQGLKSLFGTT
ncbi:MAG: DNA circularization N-terminal domain-containing protein [Bacteroidota bacterium]